MGAVCWTYSKSILDYGNSKIQAAVASQGRVASRDPAHGYSRDLPGRDPAYKEFFCAVFDNSVPWLSAKARQAGLDTGYVQLVFAVVDRVIPQNSYELIHRFSDSLETPRLTFVYQHYSATAKSSVTNPCTSILLVEDDADLAAMIAEFLSQHDFEVNIESNGNAAARRIVVENPAAVLLDLNLPGTDGFEICRQVRAQYKGPILILTARGDEVDEIVGLELGADDYLSKPVRPRILLARLLSHLRKSPDALDRSAPRQITVDDLTINAAQRTVEIEGQPLDLTSAEFDLLWFLAMQAGQVVDRTEIYRELLGFPYDGIDRSIDLRISRLRKKLSDDPTNPTRIKSVRGVGYILVLRK